MKKILLLVGLVLFGFVAKGQVLEEGMSPSVFRAAINSKFSNQTDSLSAVYLVVNGHAYNFDSIFTEATTPFLWKSNSTKLNFGIGLDTVISSNGDTVALNVSSLIMDVLDTIPVHRGLIDLNYAWIYDIMNDSLPRLTDSITSYDARITAAASTGGADHDAVTLSGTPNYITLVGQDIVRAQIDLSTDVSGSLPVSGINATGTADATTVLYGDGSWAAPPAGGTIDLSTDVGVSILDTSNMDMSQLDAKFIAAADSLPIVWGDKITATEAGGELTVNVDDIGIADLSATGTPSATTYLRGDNTWTTPDGSGGGLTQPTFTSAEIGTYTDSTIAVLWSKNLYAGANAATTDFTVTEDGSAYPLSSLSYSGDTILLLGSAAGLFGSTYLVAYDPGTNPVKDSTNLWALAFTDNAVTNNIAEGDATAPLYVSAEVGTITDSTIVALFDEALDESSVPATSAFSVSAGNTAWTVSSVAVSDDTTKLTMASSDATYADSTILWSYTVPGTNPLQDAAGNQVVAWVDSTVTNNLTNPLAYTTQYQTLLDTWSTDPTGDTLTWQNDMVYSLDSAGLWDRMDLLYVFATTDTAGGMAYTNWLNPGTTDASIYATNPPIFHRTLGVQGDTLNDGLLTSGWDPATNGVNYRQDSATIGTWIYQYQSTDAEGGSLEASEVVYGGTSNRILTSYGASDSFLGGVNGGSLIGVPAALDSGLIVMTRTASDNMQFYINTTLEDTESDASSPVISSDIEIVGTTQSDVWDGILSIMFLMDGVSSDDVTDLYNIFNRYINRIQE